MYGRSRVQVKVEPRSTFTFKPGRLYIASTLYMRVKLWFFLEIVLVSPGTHLVKNYESQSRTSESQSKKRKSPKLKTLGPLCNQTVSLKTDSKILCYSILKYKYSPSILSTTKAKRNMHR